MEVYNLRIHQRTINQITWPNHRRRPNQPPPTNTRKSKPQHLIRNRKEELKRPSIQKQ